MTDSAAIPAEAMSTLDRWVAAVGRRDIDAAAALYADEGLAFWGTFGKYCRRNRAEAREYFETFLDAEELSCTVEEAHWRSFGRTVHASGCYVFRIRRAGDGAAAQTPVRFTFVFTPIGDGKWEIVEHHSSFFADGAY